MPTTHAGRTRRQIESRSPQATLDLARALASAAQPGDLIALHGELGAGKTQLAKGFGAGLGVSVTINSPSYVLMAEYEGRLPLFHIDLYRLETGVDARAAGLLDERQAAGVSLIEWAERLGPDLPAERLDILISGSADEPRTIELSATSDDLVRYLEAIG
ncbi:MAG TPA: tRNA (adenosine(37)-N6)-threonylcarbamoyltransferase complex ATPase subunit type 1 TsaE [Candidatus Limnocylindrales bacterium]|jgi:tRNA threonylcarbamoyladenosine biosynthesis protein TsaE